jgi:protein SCO1/2
MCKFVFALVGRKHIDHGRTLPVVLAAMSGMLFGGCERQASSTQTKSSNAVSRLIPTISVEPTNAISPGMQASPSESTNILRSFLARGLVRELPADGKTMVVRHEAIPGFMPKMTMAFNVRDTNELRKLQVGDAITFNVKATEEDSWIENIRRAGTNDLAPLPLSDPTSSALLHVAQMKPGDRLPDAELLAEDGRTIKLSDFHGRALAFTFIFTRCPLPDYCPRMNQNLNRARQLLLQRLDGPTNWQFLSISFDPEFDKPGVLTRYAYSYRGQSADRWLFAAAPTNVMASMAALLDFRFANEGGSFLHNLRTVVLDPQRRIYRQFDGNTWKAQELADALAQAAMAKDLVEAKAAGKVRP